MKIVAVKKIETLISEVFVTVPDDYDADDDTENVKLLSAIVNMDDERGAEYGGGVDYMFDVVVVPDKRVDIEWDEIKW